MCNSAQQDFSSPDFPSFQIRRPALSGTPAHPASELKAPQDFIPLHSNKLTPMSKRIFPAIKS
jgi:hypothetical protein